MKRYKLLFRLLLTILVILVGGCNKSNGGTPTPIGTVTKLIPTVQAGPASSMSVVNGSRALNSNDSIHVSGGKGKAQVNLLSGRVIIITYNNSTFSSQISGSADDISYLTQGGLKVSVKEGATCTVKVPNGGVFTIIGTEAFVIYDPRTDIATAGNFHGTVLFSAPGVDEQRLPENTMVDILPGGWNKSPLYNFDPSILNFDTFDGYIEKYENPIDGLNELRNLLGIPLPNQEGVIPSGEPSKVTLWSAYGIGSADEAVLTRLVKQANVDLAAEGITVEVSPKPKDTFDIYREAMAAGAGPDMLLAPNDSLGDLARAGLFADITDLAAGRLEGYSPLSIDGMRSEGRLYGIPESLKGMALYYNRDLLPNPPANLNEFIYLLDGQTPVSVSVGCYYHWGFYGAFGGRIFDDNWRVIADQGPGIVDAYTYLNQLYQMMVGKGYPTNAVDAAAPFREGKLAMITDGNWSLVDYRAALGDRLGVAPLPAGPAGPATPLLGVDGFFFNPNSANKEAALRVALYLTSASSQVMMMNEAGHVPTRIDIQITDPLIQGFMDAFQYAMPTPQVPQMGLYWSNFCSDSDIFVNGVSPEEFVKIATANANP